MRPEYRREDLGKGVRGKYYNATSNGVSFKVANPSAEVKENSVRLMRDIHDEISGEIKDMSYKEEKSYIRERLKDKELPGDK